MGLSFLPLHTITMTQATKQSLIFHHPSKKVNFKCNNSYVNTELIESLSKENKTTLLSPENGWCKISEEIEHKYFYLTNIGTLYRKLTGDEFAKFDCGSVHKINNEYYTVLGIGNITYYNKQTNEYLKIPMTKG